MKKSKYMAGGGKSSKYMSIGGKTGKVEQHKDYVKRMFGGGLTSNEPAMKKKRSKSMARGGKS
tara:strand:+ start:236 stop:424 length:189 start_codon:yes stop_codon:yes gene_type:complete